MSIDADTLFLDALPLGWCAVVVGSRRRAKRLDALVRERGHRGPMRIRFVICRRYNDAQKLTGIRIPVRLDRSIAENLPHHIVERVRKMAVASNALFDLAAR